MNLYRNRSLDDILELRKHKWLGGWEENSDVYLWRREKGKRIVVKIPNLPRYFAIKREDYFKIDKSIWESWKKEKYFSDGIFSGNYAYIYLLPMYRTELDNWLTELDNLGIKPLEGDINRLQRLMIDFGLQVENPESSNGPKIAFFDIETDDRSDKIMIGGNRILSMAWIDKSTGEEFFECINEDTDLAEEIFLKIIYTELVQYDILVGYNNFSFDDPFIEARFQLYNIDTKKWRRVATLDHYNLFERQGTFQKYTVKDKKLDTIAQAVLGEHKIEHTSIYDTWLNNRSLLQEYNLQDVRLIYKMEQKLQSVQLVLTASSLAGLLYSAGYSPAKCIDQMLLRRAEQRRKSGISDFRYPTAYYRPEHKIGGIYNRSALSSDKRKGRKELLEEMGIDGFELVKGGLVLDTKSGLYDKVHFMDFNSLYPNTMLAFNIGLDTLISRDDNYPKNITPNGVCYRTDFVSNMADAVMVLIGQRLGIKAQLKLETDPIISKALDLQQRGIKELTNSFYGACAQWGGRHYNRDVAESITSGGRMFLPFGVEFFEARNCRIVLGDTDSLAISIPDGKNIEQLKSDYLQALRTKLIKDNNIYLPDVFTMSVEKVFSPMLVIHKKNYIGWKVVSDGQPVIPTEPTIMGIRVKKSNFPKWASIICTNILGDILSGTYKTPEHYLEYLKRQKQKLLCGEVNKNDLLISARLGKMLEDYKTENPLLHAKIAIRLREQGKHVGEYSTISYLVTNGSGLVQEGIDVSEITENTTPDYVYYWNNILMSQVNDYLEIVFPMINWMNELSIDKPKKLRKKKDGIQLKLALDKSLVL